MLDGPARPSTSTPKLPLISKMFASHDVASVLINVRSPPTSPLASRIPDSSSVFVCQLSMLDGSDRPPSFQKCTGIDIFRLIMSGKRFRFILRCLRLDNRDIREDRLAIDKMALIRRVFHSFREKCIQHYNPSDFLTMDEMLEGFRGRCPFRVYMLRKPA